MEYLELFKVVKSNDAKKNEYIYKTRKNPRFYCSRLLNMNGYKIDNVIVEHRNENTVPAVSAEVYSPAEFQKIPDSCKIISCEFFGKYDGEICNVNVEFSMSLISIIGDETIAKTILDQLE
jgi:hypothetical protein